jgi:hypothetical protein
MLSCVVSFELIERPKRPTSPFLQHARHGVAVTRKQEKRRQVLTNILAGRRHERVRSAMFTGDRRTSGGDEKRRATRRFHEAPHFENIYR